MREIYKKKTAFPGAWRGPTPRPPTRNTLSRVINGLAGISPDMAIRLAKAFGGKADIWVRMQASYDLSPSPRGSDLATTLIIKNLV